MRKYREGGIEDLGPFLVNKTKSEFLPETFYANREWREMIPVMSDYSFLPGASFTDIQLSDDELSSDEEDHEVE